MFHVEHIYKKFAATRRKARDKVPASRGGRVEAKLVGRGVGVRPCTAQLTEWPLYEQDSYKLLIVLSVIELSTVLFSLILQLLHLHAHRLHCNRPDPIC